MPGGDLEAFFRKCLFCSSAHSLIEFCCMSSICILDINPSFNMWLKYFFFHSVGCILMLSIVSSTVQML